MTDKNQAVKSVNYLMIFYKLQKLFRVE